MKKIKILGYIILLSLCIASCGKRDEQKIIGIWQNGNDWFDIKQNNVYNTGTGPTTYFKDLRYSIEAKQKQITFYTNKDGESFYMKYKFLNTDTLQLQNSMPNAIPTLFYKTKAIPLGF